MTKKILLSQIVSLRVVAIFIIVTSFVGCNVPFYTKYQVKTYLNSAQNDFNASKERLKTIQDAVFDGNQEAQQTIDVKENIAQSLKDIKGYSEKIDSINTPELAQELFDKLKDYYQNLQSFGDDAKILYDFFYLAGKTADDLTTSANKLPADYNFGKGTSKLITEFTQSQAEYKTSLQALNSQRVPDYFYQAKVALISVTEAYNDYLTSVIKGLKTKDTKYFDVDQFVRQMDDGISKFTSQLAVIETRGQFDARSKELTDKQNQIDETINSLKSQFKIK